MCVICKSCFSDWVYVCIRAEERWCFHTWLETGLCFSPGLFRMSSSCLRLKLDTPRDLVSPASLQASNAWQILKTFSECSPSIKTHDFLPGSPPTWHTDHSGNRCTSRSHLWGKTHLLAETQTLIHYKQLDLLSKRLSSHWQSNTWKQQWWCKTGDEAGSETHFKCHGKLNDVQIHIVQS